MITITEEILIKSDIQKVWSFLSDFEISLSINSFHKQIIIPNEFSLANNNMEVEILDYTPLNTLSLFKRNNKKLHKAFEHKSRYKVINQKNNTLLIYSIHGSFNFNIQNIPFKPILIKVMKNELITIKNMIESCDILPDQIESKITAT